MLLIIGFLFMVLIASGVSALVGMGFLWFFDLPSILLILVPLLFFLFVTKSGKILNRYMKTSFRKDHAYTENELISLRSAIKQIGKLVISIGGFGFVAGVLGSLINLENRSALGPNLAVSLLTLLYAIALSVFVFLPVEAWAENKINALKDEA